MTVMRAVVLSSCFLLLPVALRAQHPAIAPAPSVLFQRAEPSTPSTTPPSTHWKEGALIGGIPVGVLGFLVADGLCNDSDGGGSNCALKGVGGAVLGFLIGAVPGALIGGQIPKQE